MNFEPRIKWAFALFLFSHLTIASTGQTINYSSSGIIRSSDERVEINVISKKKVRSASSPISFPGVLGSVINLGVGAAKSILSSEEAKYTSTYSGSKSGKDLFVAGPPLKGETADLNIYSIQIIRTLVFPDLTTQLASEVVLIPDVDPSTGLFRFKLQRLFLAASKAKIKKWGKVGKLLKMSIDIKIDVMYPELTNTSKPDSIISKSKANSETHLDTSYSIKSTPLGESSIFVSGLKPEGPAIINGDHYSNWFQPIPKPVLKFGNPSNKGGVGNYQITIVVKEANPYGIKAKELSDFFNGSSADIETIIKQMLPTAAK